MLLTLIGPGRSIAPAPAGPKTAPSPAALFHAAPAQLRLVVSQAKLPEPLSQLTSAARRDAAPELAAIAASVTRCQIRLRVTRVAAVVLPCFHARWCTQESDNMSFSFTSRRGIRVTTLTGSTMAGILPA